ncbi:MAG TPA: transporter substrate-binding domain-containing protein [Candidatus Scatomorpha stercorigallinarum]|mgnify:FL=1|nr:transporter substrate-binding domain-containing protein [Candidatus Scatomorpha stercorigallinarum]
MKKLFALILALAMVFALAACGEEPAAESAEPAEESAAPAESEAPAEDAGESDLAYVQDKGTLIVGITEFEPMDYQSADGEWIGFDADMAKAFAESLGVTAEFQVIEWDNKVMELDGKTIDVVWNGMTLTDEVLSAMECSNAYCNNAQVVILPAGVADQYPDAASMAELNFAVETGSAGEDMAIENGFAYTPVVDQATAVLEVSSGTCDAAIIDSLMAAAMVGEGTSYADLTYTIQLNSEEYGVGFRKGSDLCAALNEFFVDAYADGTMQEIADTYGVSAALIAQG